MLVYYYERFFTYSILVLISIRRIASSGMPIKWKYFINSAASRILAGGPKWRTILALI